MKFVSLGNTILMILEIFSASSVFSSAMAITHGVSVGVPTS